MLRRWIILLPIMMVTFLIAFLDRTNISFAIPTMGPELGLTASVLGFSSGVLFLGYAITQAAGGWLADRGHARSLVAVLMVAWGIVAIAQGFVTSATQLVIVRFLLGLAEGGIFPTFLVIVRAWFNERERARANGIWQLCYPISAAVSGPMAGLILQHGSWKTLFIVEGILPLVWAAVWLWGMAEKPAVAKWLSDQDRAALLKHLAASDLASSAAARQEATREVVFEQLRSPAVILIFFVLLFWNIGFLGFVIWLPSVIKQYASSLDSVALGWYSSLPFAVSVISLVILSNLADRAVSRRGYAVWPLVVSALALIVGAATYGNVSFGIAMLLLTIAACGIYGVYPVVWSIATDAVPPGVTGIVMGIVNIGGVLGAFAGPYLVGYARSVSPSFASGLVLMGVCLVVAAVCTWFASAPDSLRQANAVRHSA
ncbi:MFS transporter [Paraburkholderia sp. Ac-20336]|uniref:MFS transporter n=1 Tax=Paraburkholderia sp. Ac-20336 TaxID=2703886 RepID=UPI00197F3265|nr:MFS transporter [Paraburkholderia sp. Ac-20336]MBN3804113.1 MFS transporter [Paraburkholderia sp. Ac-20336]